MARAIGMSTERRGPSSMAASTSTSSRRRAPTAFPVHRSTAIGETASAPTAYVHADNLRIERLEQSYGRVDDREYDYESPATDFRCRLVLDHVGVRARLSGRRGAARRMSGDCPQPNLQLVT